jgi:[ribosomal protein S5]-alanine N-acetyltransferase
VSITRLASIDDAEELTAVVVANRELMAPWEPSREDSFFTVAEQRKHLERALEAYGRGVTVPFVILDEGGRLAGRITLNGVTRGALQGASVGYWVSQSHNGRGLASAALAELIEFAFGELGLHRLQADTLLNNTGSQRVLERNGFKPFGVAPTYLKIAGRWQDCLMFHLFNPASE